jgi:hypothetical protein
MSDRRDRAKVSNRLSQKLQELRGAEVRRCGGDKLAKDSEWFSENRVSGRGLQVFFEGTAKT